jgi:hypothetical protein
VRTAGSRVNSDTVAHDEREHRRREQTTEHLPHAEVRELHRAGQTDGGVEDVAGQRQHRDEQCGEPGDVPLPTPQPHRRSDRQCAECPGQHRQVGGDVGHRRGDPSQQQAERQGGRRGQPGPARLVAGPHQKSRSIVPSSVTTAVEQASPAGDLTDPDGVHRIAAAVVVLDISPLGTEVIVIVTTVTRTPFTVVVPATMVAAADAIFFALT